MRRAVFKAASRGRGVRRPAGNRPSPSSLSARGYDDDEDEGETLARVPPVRKASKNHDAEYEPNGTVHNALRQMEPDWDGSSMPGPE